MDRTSIRAWRRIQEKRVWRNRIKYYANLGQEIIDPESKKEECPRDWKEYRKVRWVLKLKDTATICSCWMCRNYLYNRRENKIETQRILREWEEEKKENEI